MTGIFPSVLKTAKVVPVFQKDSKLDYNNYHSISPGFLNWGRLGTPTG